MKVWSIVTAALTIVCAFRAGAQTGSLTGVIVSNDTGEPLAYSVVALPRLGRERFTTDSGVFFFSDLPVGPVQLRVRRLGYTPAEVTFDVRAGAFDTLRIRLSRIALQLGSVTVRAYPPCREPGPPPADIDSTLAIVFSQLRMNAEQYRLLAESHPFYYAMQKVRSRRLKTTGQVRIDGLELVRIDSKAAWRYRPGAVLSRQRGAYYFHIPTLVDLADAAFLSNHCFHYGGVEEINGVDLVRIDVVAAHHIRDPDVNGSMYLDPQNYQIRRTLLRLSRRSQQMRDIMDFEVITEFQEIMPSIPVIAQVWSVQSIDPKARGDYDTGYEEQRLVAFEWLAAKPGEDRKR
jgi:hypothetical protein